MNVQSIKEKKFWESSNFWTAVALIIGGLFVGFPVEDAEGGVLNLFGIVGAFKAVREYFKQYKPKADIEKAINSSNFWNYIGVVVVSIVPNIPAGFIENIQELVVSAVGQNWQGVLVALFSIATIIFNISKKSPEPGIKV